MAFIRPEIPESALKGQVPSGFWALGGPSGTPSSLYSATCSNYIRVFLRYILQTQDREAIASFQDALQRHAPHVRGDLMTYAQELLAEGRMRNQVEVIEGLLREGVEWAVIERATGVNEAQFQALKQQVEAMGE